MAQEEKLLHILGCHMQVVGARVSISRGCWMKYGATMEIKKESQIRGDEQGIY